MGSHSIIRVLLVEDDEDDYLITRAGLSNAQGMVFDLTWAKTYAAALEAIKRNQHDVYLIDYRLDEHDGLELLREAIAFGCEAPLILLTGIGDHAVDIEAMRVGAADYLIKDQISAALLARSIRHALEHARILAALRASQARLAGILDIADDAIIAVNGRQEIELFNQGAERIFGYTTAEVLGKPLDMLLPAHVVATHHQYIQTFAASTDVARRMGERRDLFGRRRDGTEFPAEASISKLAGAGEPVFTVILRDITARKQVETRLRASVREKEILLQEVHHRVKNNLQIIKSLLRLQAYAVGDPALHELFRDSQNRVHAMALIHEQLYGAQDLAHVDCAAYLRELAGSVLRSYETQSARIALTCAIDDALALDIDTAIPLGLILTELVSNSLKHAFPADRTGTITVGLHAQADTLTVAVCDDGVGLPATVDFRTTSSLGLQLVSDLTDQLGGAVTIDRCGGTAFQICIPYISSSDMHGFQPEDLPMLHGEGYR